jgi:uncharacterized protein
VDVDVFDGTAWVGLAPFEMRMRLPLAPPMPHLSRYPATNVRTYVHDDDGQRGLWFLSVDVPRSLVVVAARAALRRVHGRGMSIARQGSVVEYRAERLMPGLCCNEPRQVQWNGTVAEGSELARFSHAAVPDVRRRTLGPYVVHVEHEPWPLHRTTSRSEDDLVRLAGLDVDGRPDHVLVSDGCMSASRSPKGCPNQRSTQAWSTIRVEERPSRSMAERPGPYNATIEG